MARVLICICGSEVRGAEDLSYRVEEGVIHARCRNTHCRLEKTLTIEMKRSRKVVTFSKMFSDFNMLFMGRDVLEKRLEELKSMLSRQLPEIPDLKPYAAHR